jgi:hypothetical protein
MPGTREITVVGGGVAGLVASIACAEGGAAVRLLEAHDAVGGRGRTTAPPYLANFGPHVLYANGALHAFLRERALLPPLRTMPMSPSSIRSASIRFRADGAVRALPPAPFARAVARLWRTRTAPAEVDFRSWARAIVGPKAADQLASSAGVFCFHHDPGSLSAAFVWARWRQAFHAIPSQARWVVGGWERLIDQLAAGARERGVRGAGLGRSGRAGAGRAALPVGSVSERHGRRTAHVTILGSSPDRIPEGDARPLGVRDRGRPRDFQARSTPPAAPAQGCQTAGRFAQRGLATVVRRVACAAPSRSATRSC